MSDGMDEAWSMIVNNSLKFFFGLLLLGVVMCCVINSSIERQNTAVLARLSAVSAPSIHEPKLKEWQKKDFADLVEIAKGNAIGGGSWSYGGFQEYENCTPCDAYNRWSGAQFALDNYDEYQPFARTIISRTDLVKLVEADRSQAFNQFLPLFSHPRTELCKDCWERNRSGYLSDPITVAHILYNLSKDGLTREEIEHRACVAAKSEIPGLTKRMLGGSDDARTRLQVLIQEFGAKPLGVKTDTLRIIQNG